MTGQDARPEPSIQAILYGVNPSCDRYGSLCCMPCIRTPGMRLARDIEILARPPSYHPTAVHCFSRAHIPGPATMLPRRQGGQARELLRLQLHDGHRPAGGRQRAPRLPLQDLGRAAAGGGAGQVGSLQGDRETACDALGGLRCLWAGKGCPAAAARQGLLTFRMGASDGGLIPRLCRLCVSLLMKRPVSVQTHTRPTGPPCTVSLA